MDSEIQALADNPDGGLYQIPAMHTGGVQSAVEWLLEQSVPPTHRDSPDKILEVMNALYTDRMQIWFYAKPGNGRNHVKCIVLTMINEHRIPLTRTLLVYAAAQWAKIVRLDEWMDVGFRLMEYAKTVGCTCIEYHTESPLLVDVAKRLNGNASYMYCNIPL